MAKKSAGSTPATVALTRLGISFTERSYAHDAAVTDFGAEAVSELGVPAERVFKTLLADVDGVLAVGVVPVAGKLDLKALAAALGGKKASMADPALAERRTGYVVGGISPVGQRTRLRTVVDASAMDHDTVLVSGGRRGLDLELAPAALCRATDAILAPIGRNT
ncbi:Cys-tRNA(Pro) deacylase [Leucobacter chromiireducens]|uniref:Cys-tRNA(Pro)/Cys-tRNA(Cys) deacylase n=1 Tax=Leucobacter chromiireducens subsp. solipictus TaxID=398235 RepID=A0ABS1SIB8_9MICO|nr:Cys-tRNA(Pro) deacylase [Leucobacter chromiireducens]MBL3679229.1 Cys-tRNA(Pro) deacylase [Leucobacter chromiireducens subsp. solipictus]